MSGNPNTEKRSPSTETKQSGMTLAGLYVRYFLLRPYLTKESSQKLVVFLRKLSVELSQEKPKK